MTSNPSNRVETTSRLAQWRIENLSASTRHKSDPFKIGKWNWYLSMKNDTSEKIIGLFLKESSITEENPPIASFILRVVCSARYPKVFFKSEVIDRQFMINQGLISFISCELTNKIMIDIEFLDLKIASPEGGEPSSIWADGSTQKQLHAPALVSLGRMFRENIHTDITINAHDGNVRAHRAVLASRSPIFHRMFSHNMKEKELSTINISDISMADCLAFLSYMYGNIQHKEFLSHGLSLLRVADKYDIADLKEACDEILLEDIGTKNVLERLELACLYQMPKLKTSCMQYLVEFGKLRYIKRDVFNAFLHSADKDLIAEIFHEVLNVWKCF